MREIPDLQTFCLRAVGSKSCSAEDTFAKLGNGEPSTASRLLRSFHKRPVGTTTTLVLSEDSKEIAGSIQADPSKPTIEQIPLARCPCIGPGSSRRVNANEVDLNHPIVGCRRADNDDGSLIMEYGSPALDVLQAFIDSLVELGRMDDNRIGVHFLEEWKITVLLAAGVDPLEEAKAANAAASNDGSNRRPSKRRRGSARAVKGDSPVALVQPPVVSDVAPALGALSLHNCTMEAETFNAIVQAGIGPHLAVIDLTGLRGLTDEFAAKLLSTMPNLKRLSLKNCRKVTAKTAQLLAVKQIGLVCLDVGGCFNIAPEDVLSLVPTLPALVELHASGLKWSNETLHKLVELRDTWKGLSLGFTDRFSQAALRENLVQLGTSLVSLALPFCENVVDNALLGMLGRNLPLLKYLDLRGNPALNTVTGFYDGRASADLPVQALTVLARYSSLTENSVEETRRAHPQQTADDLLTVYLDGGGMGSGISRVERKEG